MTDIGTGPGRKVGTKGNERDRPDVELDDDVVIDLRGPEAVIDLRDREADPAGAATRPVSSPAPTGRGPELAC